MSFSIVIPEIGTPQVLKRRSVETASPKAGEVLIRNHAAGVNFIDTIIRRGEMPEGMMPTLPHTPGVEGAGIVEALGEGVDDFKVGDRVAWMGSIGAGGYGSHATIGNAYVTPISNAIDFNRAASMPVNGMTAYHMLVNFGGAKAGNTVLVHAAAGGVGTMIQQIAKHFGMTVLASVSGEKKAYARAQGADHVIDYKNEDLPARVMDITDGRGVDLALNPLAGKTVKTDLDALAPLGTTVLFGFLAGQPAGTFQDDLAKHFQKSISVRVSDIYTYYAHRPKEFKADLEKVFELLSNNVLQPQITVLPIDEASEAHRRLETCKTTGKLVLQID